MGSYLDYSREINLLVQKHNYYGQIDSKNILNLKYDSFLISYLGYLSIWNSVLDLRELVNDNIDLKVFLNEENSELNIYYNSYFDTINHLVDIDSKLKLRFGLDYLDKIRNSGILVTDLELEYVENSYVEFKVLGVKLHDLGQTLFVENSKSNINNLVFNSWFPIQKKVTEKLGLVAFKPRGYHIKSSELDSLKSDLVVGDIFVLQLNYKLTNVGIPGFWSHSGIYLGNYSYFGEYFSDIKSSLELDDLLRVHGGDDFFNSYSGDLRLDVIEALANGVLLYEFRETAARDNLGVMRPSLNKSELLSSILVAISFYEKPYDYNFNFVTDNALVCSELIYKTYKESSVSYGINFSLDYNLGKNILSPNGIVKYFSTVEDSGLSFIAYLDSSLISNFDESVVFGNEESFKKSYLR